MSEVYIMVVREEKIDATNAILSLNSNWVLIQ